MKGIVVTSTPGITGKSEAKTRLTLICFNKREEKKRGGGRGGGTAEETEEEADGTRRKQRKDAESQHLAETAAFCPPKAAAHN